jgi:biotin carboxyl carrier protein
MERALILGALAVSASAFTVPAVHRPTVGGNPSHKHTHTQFFSLLCNQHPPPQQQPITQRNFGEAKFAAAVGAHLTVSAYVYVCTALRNAGGMAGSPAAVLGRSMGSAPRRSSALLSLNMGDITMPALSSTMKEGKIVQWTVTEGQKVSAGDVLMVVESDKVMMMNNDTLPHTLITKCRIMDPNHEALVPFSVRFLDPRP